MPYVQPPMAKSCKPVAQYHAPCEPLDACTVYRSSFCPPVCVCRAPPSRMHDNLKPLDCKMEDQTIHKLSYPCHPCTKPPSPVSRCDDPHYNPIVHPVFLRNSSGISEGCSVMQMSYKPPCPQQRQRSYKPIAVYQRPDKPFQNETVSRMSYVPWPVKCKEAYPWACQKTCLYNPTHMESTSIYQSSYFPPGEYT